MRSIARVVVLALAACGDDTTATPDAALDAAPDAPPDARPDAMVDAGPRLCDSEMRDDDYVAGMVREGANGYRVALVSSTPAIGRKGFYTWAIRAEDPTMAPLSGLTITAAPFMPDHGHGTSPAPVITDTGNGTYGVDPVNLYMAGYWTIRITLRDAEMVQLDQIIYRFCVD